MKTKTKITEIEQGDLVDLFSTATYGNNWLSIVYDRTLYRTKYKNDDDCLEDIWARMLLGGETIYAVDHYAEDETEKYSRSAVWEDDVMKYPLTLKKVKDGLQKALDSDSEWVRDSVTNLINSSTDFDLTQADALMQMIMFGEVVYG